MAYYPGKIKRDKNGKIINEPGTPLDQTINDIANLGGAAAALTPYQDYANRPAPAPPEDTLPTKPTISSAGTGKSTVQFPDGRTLVGIGNKEAKDLIDNYNQKREIPLDAQTFEQYQQERQVAQQGPALQQQQQQEIQQLKENTIGLTPQRTPEERRALAGLTAVSDVLGRLPFNQVFKFAGSKGLNFDPEKYYKNPVAGLIGNAAQGVLNFGFDNIKISTLFSGYSKNITNLSSDSKALSQSSSEIALSVLNRQADVDEAITNLDTIEEAIRLRYNDANDSLKRSPNDIEEGLDLYDSMFRDLNIVILRRQALERYKLTGDSTELERTLNLVRSQEFQALT